MPVFQRGALEGFIEFTADFDGCLIHGLDGSLFTQFSVRQFEAPSLLRLFAAMDCRRFPLLPVHPPFSIFNLLFFQQLCADTGVCLGIRYIINMNLRWCFILGLVTVAWLGGQPLRADAPAADTAADNPYHPIVQRNVFGLVPIPVHNPADDVPVNPPPKITPNGIMTLFGKLQVLFKVAVPARAGQPAKDESYTLGEGERQDDIEVQKIDEASATITFDNHGIIQQLPLVASTAAPGGGPGPGGPGMVPPPGMPGMAPAVGGSQAPMGFGGRFGRNRNNPGAPNPNAGAPDFGGATAAPQNNNSQPATLSPEEQIINMEAQRAKWLDEGNPAAAILPPTVLTKQLTGPGDTGGNGGGPGIP
jgi:hypothetical protein